VKNLVIRAVAVLLCNRAVSPDTAAKAVEAVFRAGRQKLTQIRAESAQNSAVKHVAGPTAAMHATHQVEKNDASMIHRFRF